MVSESQEIVPVSSPPRGESPPGVGGRPRNPLASHDAFMDRHLGPCEGDVGEMLTTLGFRDLADLTGRVVPSAIQLERSLDLPSPLSERQALAKLRGIARQNRVFRSFIGAGYHASITPAVIVRNVLENPGWYTPYTPYQAEIAQGRLEGLFTFQSMICDLTGMDVANASLLDEATACAEALTLCRNSQRSTQRRRFVVSEFCHPQNVDVLRTRASATGVDLVVVNPFEFELSETVIGVLLQFPATSGEAFDYRDLVERAHAVGALVVVAVDLLSLLVFEPPGRFGVDVVVGSAQRFGVPLGYGGPHAGFMATRDRFKRQLPGRVVGISRDARGKPAYRLALQTREQHIRREKATSNICTAQALLANMAAFYAMYHGPQGLRGIAQRVQFQTYTLASGLEKLGHRLCVSEGLKGALPDGDRDLFGGNGCERFDTLRIEPVGMTSGEVLGLARRHSMNLRHYPDQTLGISLDETTSEEEIDLLLRVFNRDQPAPMTAGQLGGSLPFPIKSRFSREIDYLQHPVFNAYHSETEMMRWLKRLETRDLSLTTSMIPLGSCTMKLNAASQMLPVSWPEFADLHPFAPLDQAEGYAALFRDLEAWLAEITGFSTVSLQPNAGSQGEFAGLIAIRRYHASRQGSQRDVCLIPSSAHGTNPASAVMAGMKVVAVRCDSSGNIDLDDLRAKAAQSAETLAALMVTYPSTHGVFEPGIREICRIIHDHGGQVYLDGANLNAQVGLCRPAEIGADVCHINLHKTFCIPHGGGGPGMGPICVAPHLAAFLPGHPSIAECAGELTGACGAVSSAAWGSPGILPISWMYIAMMGSQGLTTASQIAILNANYMAHRLASYYPVLYADPNGFVAHECILDLRPFKSVTVEDVAKRLMDYGFHAPTVSWPVAGTLMIEPTESEAKGELDRFCEAMIRIHGEIQRVEQGKLDPVNNPLKNAPHTMDQVMAEVWDRPYTREEAAFPVPWLRAHKFWPAVARIDNVHGDRNPVCTCAGLEAYEQGAAGQPG